MNKIPGTYFYSLTHSIIQGYFHESGIILIVFLGNILVRVLQKNKTNKMCLYTYVFVYTCLCVCVCVEREGE